MIETVKYILDDNGILTFKPGIENVESGDIPANVTLNKVIFPEGVVSLGVDLFKNNHSVKAVQLPNTLQEIGSGAFAKTDLGEIYIPDSVKIIGDEAFLGCESLARVRLSENITQIFNFTFCSCQSLWQINIPKNVRIIYDNAFSYTGLVDVVIPEGVNKIKKNVFSGCIYLKTLSLPASLDEISFENTFLDCRSLSDIKISQDNYKFTVQDNVIFSKDMTSLYFCPMTKKGVYTVPNGVEIFEKYCFSECGFLTKINMPDTLKIVKRGALQNCHGLTEVYFPDSVEKIEYYNFLPVVYDSRFIDPGNPEKVELGIKKYSVPVIVKYDINVNNFDLHNPNLYMHFLNTLNAYVRFNDKVLPTQGRDFIIKQGPYGLFFRDEKGNVYLPDKDRNLIQTTEKELLSKANKWNKIAEKRSIREYYTQLYVWNQYKDVPNILIIEHMPIDEIQFFYYHNNFKNWQLISKTAGYKNDTHKGSLFDIAHALGVFSENGTESRVATEFIINNILPNFTADEVHELFGGFDAPNTQYNAEFAKFFMKYFPTNPHFMTFRDDLTGTDMDLLGSAYNNFDRVLKILPNKKVITPEMVQYALIGTRYQHIDERAQELADVVGRFGYSQDAFETLQNWYLQGISIRKEDLKLKVIPDDGQSPVQYELLDKADPQASVLGNITNCCQVVGGSGEDCVKYGMTQENSGFVVFKKGDKVLGQAWVWYDENKSLQVTLDNIEVPKNINILLQKDKKLQQDFLDCIDRLGKNFINTMNREGLPVSRVTIGTGFNDVNKILMPRYALIRTPDMLSSYHGYSDAMESQLLVAGEMPKVQGVSATLEMQNE